MRARSAISGIEHRRDPYFGISRRAAGNQPIASATRAAINPNTPSQDRAPISNSMLAFIHSPKNSPMLGGVSHINFGGLLCQFLVAAALLHSIKPAQAVIPQLWVGFRKRRWLLMFGIIVRLLKNEEGLTAIEYALIAALMLIAAEEMS